MLSRRAESGRLRASRVGSRLVRGPEPPELYELTLGKKTVRKSVALLAQPPIERVTRGPTRGIIQRMTKPVSISIKVVAGEFDVPLRYTLLAAVVSAFLAACAAAAEVEIVRDGRALACIVLAPNAHPLEKEAADDLRWAVREATGVTLDLHESAPPAECPAPIRIGSAAIPKESKRAQAMPSRWADLPYDGACVQITPDGIDIAGPTPAGTANGVATLLLEDIGVRTYYPDPLFTIVPKATSIRIRSRVARPSLDYRVWSGLIGRDAAAYRRRNRLTDSRVPIPYFRFGHNLGNIISRPVYGEEHPEYFAFRDGARQPQGEGGGSTTQPCFTNPDVIRITIEAARRFFDEHPERDTFSLCVNDNARYCECEKCAALDKPYRNLPVGRQYSESYYSYVSKVAEAVARSHPGRFLGVYAYWNVEQPPRNRKRLPENVIVALTLDILQHYDPAYRDKDRALTRAWAGYVKRLHTYVYYGLGWFTPRTSPRLVADDLRFAAQSRVRAIYCESYPFWAWCGPMHYVAARLQWDVNDDVGRILEEFHRDCFGEAAVEMRAFHDTCERYWTRPRAARWFEGLDHLGPEEAMADTAILREARWHLDAAFAGAQDPKVRARIAWLKKGFDFTAAIGEAFEAKKAAAAGRDGLERLIAAASAVEVAYEVLTTEPAYRHGYYKRGRRFENKCWRWFNEPLRAAAEARWKELQAAFPRPQAEAKWKIFEKDSGLANWLKKRGWEFRFDQQGQ